MEDHASCGTHSAFTLKAPTRNAKLAPLHLVSITKMWKTLEAEADRPKKAQTFFDAVCRPAST